MLPTLLPRLVALFSFFGMLGALSAHPIPDIPVRSSFETGGAATIHVEIDPRTLSADPLNEPFLLHEFLRPKPEAERAALIEQARALVSRSVEFYLEPLGRVVPDFRFEFTAKGGAPLVKNDDPVMISGVWKTNVPAGIQGFRIVATPAGRLSVLFLNTLRGVPVDRTQVLFPGESSYLLDLSGLSASEPTAPISGSVGANSGAAGWWRTFADFLRQGFLHVLPLGLDHILFVLGLFLLSREWKPVLWQVTTFTLAHTVTLGLATFGAVHVPANLVEPVIAFSLVFVAMENILRPRYSGWRIVVVFVFGLVHGLGFAGALKELDLPTSSLVVGLVGFNVGVECGQLAVIAIAFLATVWIRDAAAYRRAIVIPGSAAIAILGLWWTVTRVLG